MLTGSHQRPDGGRGPRRDPVWGLAARILGVVLPCVVSLALAQDAGKGVKAPAGPKPAPAPAAAPATPPAVVKPAPAPLLPGELEPAEYLVRDKEGKFQHLLNFSFEDFMRLYKLQHQLDNQDQKPHYIIQNVQLSGTAGGQYAELAAEFTIDVQDTGWVRVPLRLPGAILRQEAEYQGPGEHLLNFEDQQEGYVSWIRSEPGKTHKVTLKLLVPLVSIGGDSELKLNLPRAPLSQLKLLVPVDHAQARVSEGSELLKPELAAAGKTQLTVLRVGGDFELAWHASESNVATVPIVLEASGALLARIDGRSVNTEARLSVRSFGGQFERFRLRLPPGAELVGASQAGVQFVPVEGQDVGGRLIEVVLGRKTTGPVELRMVTERPHNFAEGEGLFELAGFEVLGAVRQWGHIAVQVVGDWQLVWGPRRNVRQVDNLPEGLRRDDLAAGFEYYVQPYSLTARVVPQKTRTSVEPEYIVFVGAHQAELQARWKYTVRGAKLRNLEIELPGWEIDDIGPPGLVNPEAPQSSDSALWSVPLAQPAAGQFEVTLRAHKTLDAGDKDFAIELPRPHADTVSQGLFVALPADNVELAPSSESLLGLSAQTLKPPLKLPERQQDPLYYRAEGSTARFAAGMKIHPQAITADVLSNVTVDEQSFAVEQRMVFQVAYEPVDNLLINVPRTLPLDALNITLDGQRLTTGGARGETGGTADEVTPLRLPLPAPRIGRLELKVSYLLPHDKLLPVTTMSLAVPLAMPGTGKLVHNQLRVSPQAGILATARKGPWEPEAGAPVAQNSLWLSSRQAPADVSLAVELKQRQPEGKTVVECGWIQTVLADHGRQDRVVYRFKTGERQLRLALPAGADQRSLEGSLDGKPLAVVETDVPGEFLIPLPLVAPHTERLLEMRYYFADRPTSGILAADPPELKPTAWVRRLYWELVVPATEHLVLPPGNFSSEFSWARDGLVWQRRPTLEQAELETLLGSSTGLPQPAGANRYLFSTVGHVAPLDVLLVSRSVLVFAASFALLGLALALIYFPALRHPALLVTLGVLVLAGSLIKPETAVMVAQAASLGLVLALIAWFVARHTLRRPLPPEPLRGSSRAIFDRSATEAYYRSLKSGQSTTATAVAVELSPQSEP